MSQDYSHLLLCNSYELFNFDSVSLFNLKALKISKNEVWSDRYWNKCCAIVSR